MERSPVLLIVFSLLTCGIYLVIWYFSILGELKNAGRSPTGNNPWLDFLLVIVTCGIWGMIVDYKISKAIYELQVTHGLRFPSDNALIVVLLDLFGLGLVSSALQQSEINKLWSVGTWA